MLGFGLVGESKVGNCMSIKTAVDVCQSNANIVRAFAENQALRLYGGRLESERCSKGYGCHIPVREAALLNSRDNRTSGIMQGPRMGALVRWWDSDTGKQLLTHIRVRFSLTELNDCALYKESHVRDEFGMLLQQWALAVLFDRRTGLPLSYNLSSVQELIEHRDVFSRRKRKTRQSARLNNLPQNCVDGSKRRLQWGLITGRELPGREYGISLAGCLLKTINNE